MSSEAPDLLNNGDDEFEQALIEVEHSLNTLKQRYARVRQAQQQQTELLQRQQQIRPEWDKNQSPQLEKELIDIREQLQEIEVSLESSLLSDRNLKAIFWEGLRRGLLGEVFWQIVRFGGLGIMIGWLLKSCTG
jgi:protein subunit release factor A